MPASNVYHLLPYDSEASYRYQEPTRGSTTGGGDGASTVFIQDEKEKIIAASKEKRTICFMNYFVLR